MSDLPAIAATAAADPAAARTAYSAALAAAVTANDAAALDAYVDHGAWRREGGDGEGVLGRGHTPFPPAVAPPRTRLCGRCVAPVAMTGRAVSGQASGSATPRFQWGQADSFSHRPTPPPLTTQSSPTSSPSPCPAPSSPTWPPPWPSSPPPTPRARRAARWPPSNPAPCPTATRWARCVKPWPPPTKPRRSGGRRPPRSRAWTSTRPPPARACTTPSASPCCTWRRMTLRRQTHTSKKRRLWWRAGLPTETRAPRCARARAPPASWTPAATTPRRRPPTWMSRGRGGGRWGSMECG